MMFKILKISVCCLCLFAAGSTHGQTSVQKKATAKFLKLVNADFKTGDLQYQLLMKKLPAGRFPKTYYAAKDSLETSGPGWWCSGFYPGTLLYLYQQTGDNKLLTEANRALGMLTPEQFNTTTHDLGFMMYCSFGTALKIAPKKEYRQILINSAKSLVSRFNPRVGCIKSWDSKKNDFLVIIDNMMNLELLFWATQVTGDSTYYKVAVTHANTTMKNHFRPDYSSYHVVNYDPQTGAVQQRRTAQGYSDQSAWARGQTWGLYGYTVMYRETHDRKYLDQAMHIADFILARLPADKIPYWDFNAPNIPLAPKDASAAAILASGLLELGRYVPAPANISYFNTAQAILDTLSHAPYMAASGTNGGFILEHSVGNIPGHTEIDVPLTYADYYFIEALTRYKDLHKIK